mmetsp:Transcript_22511/g.62172  ORF Transcript_22511/g.62172 Transcript_22511/m.62172 type:complete len:167 (+) Transcript_22511:314-814(+)
MNTRLNGPAGQTSLLPTGKGTYTHVLYNQEKDRQESSHSLPDECTPAGVGERPSTLHSAAAWSRLACSSLCCAPALQALQLWLDASLRWLALCSTLGIIFMACYRGIIVKAVTTPAAALPPPHFTPMHSLKSPIPATPEFLLCPSISTRVQMVAIGCSSSSSSSSS